VEVVVGGEQSLPFWQKAPLVTQNQDHFAWFLKKPLALVDSKTNTFVNGLIPPQRSSSEQLYGVCGLALAQAEAEGEGRFLLLVAELAHLSAAQV